MKFYCIADEDTVRGFRLAGVEGRVVSSPAEAGLALRQVADRPELGIVLVTQQVAAGIRAEADAFRLERDRPLLVEIPGPAGPAPGHRGLRQLVHSAVGIRVEKGD